MTFTFYYQRRVAGLDSDRNVVNWATASKNKIEIKGHTDSMTFTFIF